MTLMLTSSLDNSEWMRNGDFLPTRLDAQAEAVQLICGAKTRGNPENTVSVMTLADRYGKIEAISRV
jgi:26S proteasome regulatory subunit N10